MTDSGTLYAYFTVQGKVRVKVQGKVRDKDDDGHQQELLASPPPNDLGLLWMEAETLCDQVNLYGPDRMARYHAEARGPENYGRWLIDYAKGRSPEQALRSLVFKLREGKKR